MKVVCYKWQRSKLEERIMDLIREYRMNAFDSLLHEQLMNPAWRHNRS